MVRTLRFFSKLFVVGGVWMQFGNSKLSISNGFYSSFVPQEIKQLNLIEQRAVAPLLPSLQIVRDRKVTQGTTGGDLQIIELNVSDFVSTILDAVDRLQESSDMSFRVQSSSSVIDIPVNPEGTVAH